MGLGQAWWSWVHDEAEESEERLCAAHNLTHCRFPAKQIEREMLGVRRRMLGEEHAETPASTGNLALSLSDQGRYAAAERIERGERLGSQGTGSLCAVSSVGMRVAQPSEHKL